MIKAALLVLVALIAAFGAEAFVAPKKAFLQNSSSLQMTVLSYNGKKKNFKPGSPLSNAVRQLGVPVKYSCKKGDCATCQVSLAGRMTRACIGKVPEEPKLKSLQEKGLEIRA